VNQLVGLHAVRNDVRTPKALRHIGEPRSGAVSDSIPECVSSRHRGPLDVARPTRSPDLTRAPATFAALAEHRVDGRAALGKILSTFTRSAASAEPRFVVLHRGPRCGEDFPAHDSYGSRPRLLRDRVSTIRYPMVRPW
jgi:hypothetical protein